MDKKILIYLIFIFNFFYALEFDFESIEDYIPKTSILHLKNSFSFKIFEYIPKSSEDQKKQKIFLFKFILQIELYYIYMIMKQKLNKIKKDNLLISNIKIYLVMM